MTKPFLRRALSRRRLLTLGAGALTAGAGARLLPGLWRPAETIASAQGATPPLKYHLAATDGWISMPPDTPAIAPYFPDMLAPSGLNTYIFGFANVTGKTDAQVAATKNHAQASAPILWFDEGQPYSVKLTNLGLAQRPDLIDSHTIHWHGFRNAIPMFDGEPSSSVAVPIGRSLTYFYRPTDAGTYMYHCHFEDTEHVHMGMTGVIYVRAKQNSGAFGPPAGKYAYNDGLLPSHPNSTAYDREYVVFLSEIWGASHWADAHIQLPEWTDYTPDFYLLNGRAYPDTLAPGNAASGRLQYQPISSLVQANAGERVLLRLVNLGYTQQSMTLEGIRMRVVGKDATLLRGRDGTDASYLSNTVSIGPGESVDAIFTAPAFSAASSYDTYLLYNRDYSRLSNGGAATMGGQMTEVRIMAAGTLGAQTEPNT